MNQPRLRIGDQVVVDPEVARAADRGVTYRVTKTLKVNVVVEPDGGGRPLRINPIYLLPAPETPTTPNDTVGRPYQPPLDQGTVVTVAGPGWTQPPDRLYIVMRDNGDRLAIVKLGGEQGRYWRVGSGAAGSPSSTRPASPSPHPSGRRRRPRHHPPRAPAIRGGQPHDDTDPTGDHRRAATATCQRR